MPKNSSFASTDGMSRKALFNCLRLQARHSLEGIEAWQIEDYRKWPIDRLFQQLRKLGWQLDRASFLVYAESVEGPEQLLDLLLGEEDIGPQQEDRLYLIIFELWRRLIPHGESVELLCDELDYQIYAYEEGEQVDTKVEMALLKLAELVHEETGSLKQAREAFAYITKSCAQDIELFLYDFILDQFEAGALDYAKELHARFASLVQEPLWFDLVKVRWSDNDEALQILRRVYSSLKQEPSIEILFEVVSYLSEHEVGNEFQHFFELLAQQPLSNEEKAELRELAQTYLHHHEGSVQMRQQILNLLARRSS